MFDARSADALQIISSMVGSEALMIFERKKSLDVARYFDASFNNAFPQLLIDRSGKIIKASKHALNLTDQSTSEVAGRSLSEFFAIDQDSMAKLGNGIIIETTSKASGRRYRISANAVSEKVLHILLQDVTQLEELDAKASLLDSSSEAYLLLDKEGVITWASSGSGNVIGINRDMILGRKLADIISKEDAKRFILESVGENGYHSNASLNLGNETSTDAIIRIYRNKTGYSCIISKDYGKYLASAQKGIDDMIELSGDSIILLDQSGYIKGFNKATEKTLNYKDGELRGTPIVSLCADIDSQNRLNSSISIAKNSNVVTDIFVNMVRKNTTEPLPFMQSIKTMKDENDKVTGYIVLNKELSTKKRMEQLESDTERFSREAKDYKSESDLKTQFINNISHDLKTPITSIMGYSKLMLDGQLGDLNSEQKEYIQIILDSSSRLMQLIQQILDVAKLSSGKVKLDLQQVNFKAIGENPSIKDMAKLCENKGLEFKWTSDYDVPEVTADPNRLIQVLVNLIGNALKFTEKGGIYVNVSKKGKNVIVEVRDTGIGISKDERHKIFKKFYQIQRKDMIMPPGTGTGLGLSIVKEIVGLHEGKVGLADPIPGKPGSTFWFRIPISGPGKKKKSKKEAKPQGG